MNFQVPQFIEVEDKVFGPLTFRQFIYLAGGGGLAFMCYVYLPFYLAVFPIVGIVALSLGLAFYRFNNQPLIGFMESVFRYHLSSKLYVWKKEAKKPLAALAKDTPEAQIVVPKLSSSKLKDLSWSLDVRDTIK
jgi:hypothetical protein